MDIGTGRGCTYNDLSYHIIYSLVDTSVNDDFLDAGPTEKSKVIEIEHTEYNAEESSNFLPPINK